MKKARLPPWRRPDVSLYSGQDVARCAAEPGRSVVRERPGLVDPSARGFLFLLAAPLPLSAAQGADVIGSEHCPPGSTTQTLLAPSGSKVLPLMRTSEIGVRLLIRMPF